MMILSFININKNKQRLLCLLLLIALMSVSCTDRKYCLENDRQYTCEREGEDYVVSLYDKKGKKLEEVIFPKEPRIRELGSNIVEIKIVLGNPVSYVFYFNRETLQRSDSYFNATELEGKYIAYVDDNRLIVQDIFSEGILYEEIARDFSTAANPLINIKLVNVENREFIYFEYVKGEDYQIIEESLEIYPNKL